MKQQITIQSVKTANMAGKTGLNCLNCSLLAILMLFFQQAKPQQDFSWVESMLKQYQKSLGEEVVVMVSKDGKTIFQRETESFKVKTPALIASCSKWLTAAVVMIYVDEGKISLDDKVGKYLPIFNKYLKGYITIRHCLSHTTGIESESEGVMRLLQRSRFPSLEEEVNAFVSKRDIVDNAGEAFAYSNIGLNIAARVLEVVGKKSFDRIAQEKLFRPLGMRQTTFYTENGAVNPSGGAHSSAFDYLVFLNMLLNKGMHNGKRILSEASIREMQTAQTKDISIRYTPKVAQGYRYGLGEWIQEMDEKGNATVVSCPGLFGTWPYIDLKRNYACIIFTKSLLSEQKREIYLRIKDEIDSQIR
jgi:CubicO group peptidase (beta-lactamase class C family)